MIDLRKAAEHYLKIMRDAVEQAIAKATGEQT